MKLSVYKNDVAFAELELGGDHSRNISGPEEYFIGRSSDCHLVLDHPQVSRQHAVLIKQGPTWILSKSSGFGIILVNGSPVERKDLVNGDIISISPFIIHVSIAAPAAPVTAPDPGISLGEGLPPSPAPELIQEKEKEAKSPPLAANEAASQEVSLESDMAVDEGEEEKSQEALDGEGAKGEGNSDQSELGASSDNQDPFGGFSQENKSDPFNSPENSSSNNLEGGNEGSQDNQFANFNDGQEGSSGDVAQIDYSGDGQDAGADDKTNAVISFAQFTLKIFGEFAPYDEFVINDAEVFIGRNKEKCQIALDDPEVSGVHAVLKKSRFNLILEDLDSSNGTILNGSRINSSDLSNNDEFVIGSTTFTVMVKSDLLQSENDRLMPVEDNQEVVVEEVVEEEVDFLDEKAFSDGAAGADGAKGGSLLSKEGLKDPAKRKKLLYAVVGILLVYVLLGEDEEAKKNPEGQEKSKEGAAKSGNKPADGAGNAEAEKEKALAEKKKRKLTKEEKEYLEAAYQLAHKYYSEGMYKEAEDQINKIFEVSEDGYKQAKQLKELISEGYKKILALKEKEERELAEQMRKKQVDDLVAKAKEAVKERRPEVAEAYFAKILELDPEQSDVSLMKMELDAWKKEKEREELEKAQKEAERNRKVNALNPGKTFYLKKQWFRAINKLEEFLKIQNMDEDLIKDATKMLEESKTNLNKMVSPLLGKARSLKEGQDLKGAYENYLKVLKIDPSNTESLNEMSSIRDILDIRLRKIYREAIIAESLSLFNDAKEKFQEVQQVSPTDNEYYRKATEKLKDYAD